MGTQPLPRRTELTEDEVKEGIVEKMYGTDQLAEMVSTCDYVVMSTPFTPQTHKMFGKVGPTAWVQTRCRPLSARVRSTIPIPEDARTHPRGCWYPALPSPPEGRLLCAGESRAPAAHSLPRVDREKRPMPSPSPLQEAIAAMKKSAVFVNIGRGKCVDEDALVDALEAGRIRGAVLDVAYTEPLPRDSKLWGLPNVILSPHCADRTDQFQVNAHRPDGSAPGACWQALMSGCAGVWADSTAQCCLALVLAHFVSDDSRADPTVFIACSLTPWSSF